MEEFEQKERIKNASREELERLAATLTEDNERLRKKVNNVSKNSYDVTDSDTMVRLSKELKKAARECLRFGNYYQGGNGTLPSGEYLQKFINIY